MGRPVYDKIYALLSGFYSYIHLSAEAAGYFNTAVSVLVFLLIIFAIRKAAAVFLVRIIDRLVRDTKTIWDDSFKESGFFVRAVWLLPLVIAWLSVSGFIPPGLVIEDYFRRIIMAAFAAASASICGAFLDGVNLIYQKEAAETARRRPIKGHIQLFKIFIYIVGLILAVTALLKVSPVGILSGLGAMSAVLLLVFKDSILGFVSSLQLAGNDMVRIGDWIEMPSYNTDGNVIDITLQSVKVRNWDNTISTIPIYALVSDSFKNWRGMSESGARRIKRSISIDMRSVHFLSREEIEKLSKIKLIKKYMEDKLAEVSEYNRACGIPEDDYVSGRRLTNLGTFRAYAQIYLESVKEAAKGMTNMVRYLQPDENGLQVEFYFFSSDTVWENYENIQADIIDHLLAVLEEFDLRVFQNLCGSDLQALGRP